MAEKTPDNPTAGRDLSRDGSAVRFTWTGSNALGGTDTTSPISFCEFADRSVQFTGTFGGATVVWEGSNDDGSTYFQLNDLSGGNAISKNAAGGEGVAEITQFARARTSGGDTTTAVAVSVVMRRGNPRGR